jgi:hypothetical protein
LKGEAKNEDESRSVKAEVPKALVRNEEEAEKAFIDGERRKMKTRTEAGTKGVAMTTTKLAARVVSAAVVAAVAALVASGAAADVSPAEKEMLALYDRMQVALADDTSAGVEEAAKALALKAEEVGGKAKSPAPFQAVTTGASAVVAAADLEAEREAFRDLSKAMAKLVESGQLGDAGIFFCPMADAYWLQKPGDDALRNPYYGKSMLACGSKVDKVED